MKLYRLVSEEEARDIEEAGGFRHPYGGLEAKEFWLDKTDAITYLAATLHSNYSPPYIRLMSATLHAPLAQITHEQMVLDERVAVVVRGEELYRLNRIITLEWVNLNSND